MYFEKLKKYGKNIKMTSKMKEEIIYECSLAYNKEKRPKNKAFSIPKVRVLVAVACVLLILVGVRAVSRYDYSTAANNSNILIQNKIMATNKATTSQLIVEPTKQNTNELFIEQTTIQEKKEQNEQEEIGGGVIGLNKYRVRYYDIPYPFVYLVGEEAYSEWKSSQPDPYTGDIMLMVKFIQDFDISREDFDKANSESAWRIKYLLDGVPVMNPKDYANQEDDEVFNADVIYTFDNEVINEYYLSHDYPYWYADEYEEAVANGVYETQTTDFVEVPEAQPMPESSNTELISILLEE